MRISLLAAIKLPLSNLLPIFNSCAWYAINLVSLTKPFISLIKLLNLPTITSFIHLKAFAFLQKTVFLCSSSGRFWRKALEVVSSQGGLFKMEKPCYWWKYSAMSFELNCYMNCFLDLLVTGDKYWFWMRGKIEFLFFWCWLLLKASNCWISGSIASVFTHKLELKMELFC
jgi:hypothetical protein